MFSAPSVSVIDLSSQKPLQPLYSTFEQSSQNVPLLGHGLGGDPLSMLMRQRDDARALALRAVENGEAALVERDKTNALLEAMTMALQTALEQRNDAEAKLKALASHPSDDTPQPATDVDRVIDQLDRRLVPERDRFRLRRHLDKAEEPDRSRSGQDRALGGAIGRKPVPFGLRLP